MPEVFEDINEATVKLGVFYTHPAVMLHDPYLWFSMYFIEVREIKFTYSNHRGIASGIGSYYIFTFNLLLFSVGIATLAEGVRHQNLGVVNLGMVVVAMLVVVRFFDSGLGFIFKGFSFILVGIGFLVANVLLSRRTRATEESGP